MSHVDSKIISRFLTGIDAEYGKIAKMTITQGKIQKYLNMTINYSFPGKLIFSMFNYIGNMIGDIPEYMKGGSSTPAAQHHFILRKMRTNYPEPT